MPGLTSPKEQACPESALIHFEKGCDSRCGNPDLQKKPQAPSSVETYAARRQSATQQY